MGRNKGNYMENRGNSAKFPVIAYNLTDKEWEEPALDQYIIRKVGKLKVAVVGYTYPWTALTSAIAGSAKWYKYGIKEDEARDLIADIRKNEDPDLLVFISLPFMCNVLYKKARFQMQGPLQ